MTPRPSVVSTAPLSVDGDLSPSHAANPVLPVSVVPQTPACGSCNAFLAEAVGADSGTCRALPPRVVEDSGKGEAVTVWPEVSASADWCRQWQSIGKIQP